MWYVYIIECDDGRFYTGMTNNLERRFKEHQRGRGGRFTSTFGAKKLLYHEKQPTRSDAMRREIRIKQLTRDEKIALMASGRKRQRKSRKKI